MLQRREMQKAALLGACAVSTVALNVAMQQFAGAAGGGGDSGNNSEDDDYPPILLAANMNAQFLAITCAEGITSDEMFGGPPHVDKWYIKPRSTEWWDLFISKPETEDPEKWRALFRVSRPTFNYICHLVRRDLETFKNPSNFSLIKGREITVEKQVAIALHRLSSGDPVSAIGELFGVGNATVSKVTWRFIKSIVERARHHLKWPAGVQMDQVKAAFEELTGFPSCCGVVGSTHIRILFPPEESSLQWVDRVGNVSMVSQAIVDANMRFLDVCIGWPGSTDDATVLQNSTFYRLCEAGERLNTSAVLLERPVAEYVLGSVGYQLLPWLATPYPEGLITPDGQFFNKSLVQSAFNERHEAARVVVDKAFAYLKGVWRMLSKVNRNPNTPKLSSLVFACCLLHNILLDRGERIDEDILLDRQFDESYPPVSAEQYADSDAWQSRDVLAEYLTLHGRL